MNRWKPSLLACFAAVSGLVLASCGSARGPYNAQASDHRDIRKAEELYQEAIAKLPDNPEKAKVLLNEALGYDLYHGAAHNNLGVILLGENKLYDAAEEFEWARKLMPGYPEPRVNLAITLERGGRHGEAIEAAKAALEIRPGHLGAMETLAYLQVREGLEDKTTKGYLDTIIYRTDDVVWKEWATQQRLKINNKTLEP